MKTVDLTDIKKEMEKMHDEIVRDISMILHRMGSGDDCFLRLNGNIQNYVIENEGNEFIYPNYVYFNDNGELVYSETTVDEYLVIELSLDELVNLYEAIEA